MVSCFPRNRTLERFKTLNCFSWILFLPRNSTGLHNVLTDFGTTLSTKSAPRCSCSLASDALNFPLLSSTGTVRNRPAFSNRKRMKSHFLPFILWAGKAKSASTRTRGLGTSCIDIRQPSLPFEVLRFASPTRDSIKLRISLLFTLSILC